MPSVIAWTAMGRAGVAVSPLVAVAAGDGVTTKALGAACVGASVSVGLTVVVGDSSLGSVATGRVTVGAGEVGGCVTWPRTRTATAIRPERKLKISDPRARTMYFWR